MNSAVGSSHGEGIIDGNKDDMELPLGVQDAEDLVWQ
jgi:hypothetical protein